ncbi:MAG TPA: hypothetical protein VGO96_03490 [Pyrinomonadaceae bacterium]|jgi:hypothetical protein|nr:hypothetical protein [Pyrinomonadaceae bacterium]
MLFIQSNTLALSLDEGERLRLLDALRERGLAPLIRASRRRRFDLLVPVRADAALVEAAFAEFERECAAERARLSRAETGGNPATPYTPGEIFCAGDAVLYLTFSGTSALTFSGTSAPLTLSGASGSSEGLTTGIVYSVDTAEPLTKLDRFCRDVREALIKTRSKTGRTKGQGSEGESAALEELSELPCWKTRSTRAPQGLARFIAIQPTDFAVASKLKGGARELMRASELLEEGTVRQFLRRVQEMRREGYSPRRLFAEANTLRGGVSVERMLDAGLLEREIRVSCRKSGHALFDLPTPDSLAAITISKAKCSLCAAPVADEVVEETINPTWLAVSLLEDGGWLNNRVYKIIRSLGVPESEIATGPASTHGESYLAADVCGNSYLFVTRDGDLTPAFSRRIVETVAETEATHLVVVLTGKVEDEGRLRLYEFAWRRARNGQDLDTTLIEGLDGARPEIERSFERAVHRQLSQHLFTLDAALGLSASNFVLDWFKLKHASNTQSRSEATSNVLVPVFPDIDQRVAS